MIFSYIVLIPCDLAKLVYPNSFLVDLLGFSIDKIMSSANTDSFSSFLIYPDFISFPCLVALIRTSTLLSRSSESEYLCLVSDLRGK